MSNRNLLQIFRNLFSHEVNINQTIDLETKEEPIKVQVNLVYILDTNEEQMSYDNRMFYSKMFNILRVVKRDYRKLFNIIPDFTEHIYNETEFNETDIDSLMEHIRQIYFSMSIYYPVIFIMKDKLRIAEGLYGITLGELAIIAGDTNYTIELIEHELGHLLTLEHEPQTIMNEQIEQFTRLSTDKQKEQVYQEAELYM